MTRVMIVENPAKPMNLAKKLLPSINYDIVFETYNGYEAIEKYDLVKPDLLLLDLILEKNDGLTVLQEIKKNHPESNVMIITSLQGTRLEDCLNSGALACLSIPYKMRDFLSLVTSLHNPSQKSKIAPVISEDKF